MSAAVLIGATAAAAAVAGAYKILNTSPTSSPSRPAANPEAALVSSPNRAYAPSYYPPFANPNEVLLSPGGGPRPSRAVLGSAVESGLIPRVGDPSRYAYPELGSPGYTDQDWQRDCGMASCNRADSANAKGLPPIEGQHLDQPMGMLGDFVLGLQTETNRDASSELNEPPHPQKRLPDYGLGWGEPLESWNIPHGASEATDLEYWGPRDWDAERPHKLPEYLFSRDMELNGKEINRPRDTHHMDFDKADGEADVDWGTGAASGRTLDTRMQSSNLYGGFVTTKDPRDEKKFLPPRASPSRGLGKPSVASEINFGARLMSLFNAFMPWRDMGTRNAPSNPAEIQLAAHTRRADTYEARVGGAGGPSSNYGEEGSVNVVAGGRTGQRLNFDQWMRGGNLPPGGGSPAGPDVNPVQGGVERRIVGRWGGGTPGVWDTKGTPSFSIGANAGVDVNPPDAGYHYTTRLRTRGRDEYESTRGSVNGSGPIILHDMAAGARQPKDISGRPDYVAPQTRLSMYGGPEVAGVQLTTTRRPEAAFAFPLIGTSGHGGSKPPNKMVWTIGGNLIKGLRGGDWDGTPPAHIGEEAMRSSLYDTIVQRRSESELTDLFSVKHS